MNIPSVFWLVPVASLVALGMAWFFFRQMMAADEGTPRMKEIALYVRKGAMAYLKQQYKVVCIVFVVLCALFAFMAYGLNVQNPWVPFAFLTGGFFSGLAGFFGMKTATYASARTANAARESLDAGLKIAFRSGAVMGLTVVGLGLLDIAIWFVVLNHFDADGLISITTTMLTFGMGASTQALFARVGGGIYTKAADVGADIVGKVEADIPEDDPRNPATIADNVTLYRCPRCCCLRCGRSRHPAESSYRSDAHCSRRRVPLSLGNFPGTYQRRCHDEGFAPLPFCRNKCQRCSHRCGLIRYPLPFRY